ncbi:MAG: ABC transporter substrate-binding protein [Candidatus Thorarchaeota archaeon]|nr:ABC transporter substrate-binding protein [Candidatus Thorarchaeota archaeon]
MNNKTTKRMIALTFAVAFVLMAVSPAFAQAQTTDLGNFKTGPFVEKIVFDVITQEDQQVLALQDDAIDMIDQQLDPTYLEQLVNAENIEIESILRNGYGYVTINCDKYPLNITAFRRALAFATDKEAISDDVWDGLSQPLDTMVPATNPFSIEGQLPYTYYEANAVLGNQMLDDAGFADIDEDGFREAPDGSDFDILVECATSSNIAIEVGVVIADALSALGIEAESRPTDFYEYLNRLYFHGDYDIVFLGGGWSSFDIDWLAYEFWSDYADEPYWNFPAWRNATYDSYRDALLHSTTFEEVYDAAIAMQEIWVYECPMIICYENMVLSAYRTDKFDGWVNSVVDGVPGFWTNMKAHLKDELGGPYGGTLRWSNSLDIDTFNFMASTSAYANNVNNMMWDSLITVGPDGTDVDWLAESYTTETHADNPAVPDGHTRFTFNMLQNATWTDGLPITAEDVAFTLNYFKEAPGNQYGSDLTDLVAAYAPTPYTLIAEFDTESYWHLHTIGYKPILPKHVFEDIGPANWNTWNPDPPTEAMVTSGPFNVSEYVAGEFTELTYNPNYFFGPERITTPTNTGGVGIPNLTLAIVAGAVGAAVVILVGGFVLMRQR